MTTKTPLKQKHGLIYALNMATVDEVYEFKYELSSAMDEVICSFQGLKNVIDAWLPLGSIDFPAKDMMDEQDSVPLPF